MGFDCRGFPLEAITAWTLTVAIGAQIFCANEGVLDVADFYRPLSCNSSSYRFSSNGQQSGSVPARNAVFLKSRLDTLTDL